MIKGATVDMAAAIAERIRLSIMDSVCNFEDKEIHVTMSFGCTELNSALSVEKNIKVADELLYRAKETGRNRVISNKK
ncbi:MAG: diguanylate cyclase [Selenomonadaceae bacterium]|nr:diguanylate cyclase [Selenomonadaceae bacterium]